MPEHHTRLSSRKSGCAWSHVCFHPLSEECSLHSSLQTRPTKPAPGKHLCSRWIELQHPASADWRHHHLTSAGQQYGRLHACCSLVDCFSVAFRWAMHRQNQELQLGGPAPAANNPCNEGTQATCRPSVLFLVCSHLSYSRKERRQSALTACVAKRGVCAASGAMPPAAPLGKCNSLYLLCALT